MDILALLPLKLNQFQNNIIFDETLDWIPMKTRINILNLLVFVSIFSILLTSCSLDREYTHTPLENCLQVEYIAQKQQFWCWAACSEMVMKYLDPNQGEGIYRQCAQANSTSNTSQQSTDCCLGVNLNTSCNHTSWPVFDQCGLVRVT